MDDDLTPERCRELSRELLEAMFETMGSRIPIALMALTYDGDFDNPENLRVILPAVLKPFMEAPDAVENLVTAFRMALRRFSMHPEDRGPVGPERGPAAF